MSKSTFTLTLQYNISIATRAMDTGCRSVSRNLGRERERETRREERERQDRERGVREREKLSSIIDMQIIKNYIIDMQIII